MAKTKYVPAIGPSYHLSDIKAACQTSINCYLQRLDGDNVMLQGIPGETQIEDLSAEIRCMRNVEGRWLVVAGNTLYEQTTAGVATSRGTLLTSTGVVGMSHNQSQVAVVDGANLYIFTLATNVLTQITVAGWRGSDDVWEMDGYFIFVDPETDQFYISAIDDGTALDALDFSSADSSPDNVLAHIVNHRQLILFGTQSAEIWINAGAASFPFVRYNSYTLDVGIVGKHAHCDAADTVFWIGQTDRGYGVVYMLTGNQPQRVSTQAVEQSLLASGVDLTTATMWRYQIEGHEFIGINATGMTTTWVYDAALQQWHERGEWDAGWLALRSRHVTFVDGAHYAGDSAGIITRLDSTVYTLNGRILIRERTWPHMVQDSMEPVSYRGVEIAAKSGYGGTITLEISADAGNTFGPPLERSLGVTGRWMQRIRWLGLGTAFNRVFRLRCGSAVPFAIYSATVDI